MYVVNEKILQRNPWFIIKSVFKSRAGYNGACTVTENQIRSEYRKLKFD